MSQSPKISLTINPLHGAELFFFFLTINACIVSSMITEPHMNLSHSIFYLPEVCFYHAQSVIKMEPKHWQ